MFLISVVPFNDRFNLILVQKLAVFILCCLLCLANAQLNDRIASFDYVLKVDNYVDYSFDRLQLCDNVVIDLTNSTQYNGLLHSPDYKLNNLNQFRLDEMLFEIKTNCKWTIKAPSGFNIQLKIIDYEAKESAKCPHDRIEFRLLDPLDSSKNLWINLIDETNEQNNIKYLRNDSINNCDYSLKSFTTINTNSNRLQVAYNTVNSNLNILISFTLLPAQSPSTDECNDSNMFKCQSNVNMNLKHVSCIPKNLICNCPAFQNSFSTQIDYTDNCDYLLDNFETKQQENICEFFAQLNTQCRNVRQDYLDSTKPIQSRINLLEEDTSKLVPIFDVESEPDLEDICYSVIKTKEFGWIGSPNLYSQKFTNMSLNCTYRIILQPYQKIQLRFKFFNLDKRRTKNDSDVLTIYDGGNRQAPIMAKFTSSNNDFKSNFYAKVFNSKTHELYIQFQTSQLKPNSLVGFNFTYQIKGYCIENQKTCNSIYEQNCYSPQQRCNDVWDCNNGADERGCGDCAPDRFRCKNSIFCYRLEDRCDGDHQCIDKSDELNCDKWNCNSANGTFLCANGRCIYEQWVCDTANDCEDNSDEINCPSGLASRRVITTAVLGGTLCCLLLVMALGCACKLYTLHTATYRGSYRFAQAAPGQPVSLVGSRSRRRMSRHRQSNLSSFIRRLRTEHQPVRSETNSTLLSNIENTQSTNTLTSSNELPLPHHLIAPPTYNQTMGLVDEYEQRQLAFIEHVRSILSQQNGNLINLSAQNPPASTTIYRINRRSHRHRHHRDPERRRRHRHANNQINFDMNRRGLNENEAPEPCRIARPECSVITAARPETSQGQAQAKTSSVNLRDRITKLIKDIVVHHGDNIQYVQLADQQQQIPSPPPPQPPQTSEQRDENATSQNNSEDDVPLIQP